ncbi:hypothetical protein [Deinococcus ruber]|uniref:DUF2269 family protein n=1 Tax=Deinococcus ruber TaxID=1848197 RepID=A0A918FGN9_9DEIO|nr:hypothetical protein [Deinococcus ruber]GGR36626.1 hypothetical protein GCM10008957_52850 [Deinococcus ruber]
MSSLYNTLLFVHIVSAILLFVVEGITAFALRELRAAPHQEAARQALARVQAMALLGKLTPLVVLLSALGLCALAWGFKTPWVLLSLVGFVGIAVLVQVVDHPRLLRLKHLLGDDLPFQQLRPVLTDPVLRRAVRVRLSLLLWLVFLMTVKPALLLGLGTLLLFGVGTLLLPITTEPAPASLPT